MRKSNTAVKEKCQKKYLTDRAVSQLFKNKEYLLAVIKKTLGDELKDYNLQNMDIRINTTESYKDSRIDVGVENSEAKIDIEINYNESNETEYKNLTYICQLILEQTKHNASYKYKNIRKVYQININNYDVFKENKFIYKSRIMEEDLHKVRNNLINIYDINIDFLYEKGYNKVIKEYGKNSLEYILYVFACEDKEEVNKAYKGEGLMSKIRDAINSWEDDNFWISREEIIKLSFKEEAERLAIEKGLKQGKTEVALNLYEEGTGIDLILKATGLTKSEFEEALKEKQANE